MIHLFEILLKSIGIAILLMIAICFQNKLVRMGIVIFIYSFSFFKIILGGDKNISRIDK